MKVLCMPQAFKGSLRARDAANSMAEAVRLVLPGANAVPLPMADGGDDTLDVLIEATGGRRCLAVVRDPLGRQRETQWGVLGDDATAVVEMAHASGLRLLAHGEYDPRVTCTFGTGQLIACALDADHRRIIVGVGGSATVDGGTGAARALGVRFLDRQLNDLPPGGAALASLASIDMAGLDPRVADVVITVACDVDIPVSGPEGARAFMFQKGATVEVANELEAALAHLCHIVARDVGVDLLQTPSAGPAGAMAGGLHAFLGAHLVRGPDLVLELTGGAEHIPQASLVITGEGRLDKGSFRGKGTAVIASRARDAGVPLIAIVGQATDDLPNLTALGIDVLETLVDHARSAEDAHSRARDLVTVATATALRRYLRRGSLRYN